MRRALLLVVLLVVSVVATACRPMPAPFYGITFDNDAGASASKLNAQAQTLAALPHMPTVRVVIDPGTTPADYNAAFSKFHPIAYTMAELVDSSSVKSTSRQAYHDKTALFLSGLGEKVDVWEVGNEVNGSWLGSYADVAAKVIDAHNQVRAAGQRSAITLWENSWAPNHCGNGSGELTPQQFATRYLPASVRAQIPQVKISWFPTQCSGLANVNVPAATIKSEIEALHALFPNATIGFGELGLPRPVKPDTLAVAQSMATYYYGLDLGLSYYDGGYYWWYGAQDAVPISKPMGQTLIAAMQ